MSAANPKPPPPSTMTAAVYHAYLEAFAFATANGYSQTSTNPFRFDCTDHEQLEKAAATAIGWVDGSARRDMRTRPELQKSVQGYLS